MERSNKSFMAFLLVIVLFIGTIDTSEAQRRNRKSSANTVKYQKELTNLQYRNIGPFRGGRSSAVTGVPGKPNLFYMGAAGGGVWRTKDGGNSWENLSDGFFGGSIGAVAVSEYDNNVIYVGGGEVTIRGNMSMGSGMWKSTDAGKTWKDIGLKKSRHIPRVRIHPKNPDLVYAAVLGDVFKPTSERGIYRSKDGGSNWEKVLFVNDMAGAVDLVMDPNNSRVLYASTWNVKRTPYSMESGGPGSALWKSTDGGDTWNNIMSNKGLPKGTIGIIGVTVSPVNSERVFAIIEADEGGLFRSDDAGENWTKVNSDRSLRQRAWYYSKVHADTQDEDIVYVMNVSYHKSKDGGKTFTSYNAPHGDHHDLWIAPEDNQRLIIADDGGGQVSYDAGENWTTYGNQPTAQFYRVTTDNAFPYRIYGAQQDNSTVRIRHRTGGGSIGERDWEPSAGGESAHMAIDPNNNDIVYGGSYGGYLTRVDHANGQSRNINVWPDNPMGYGAEGMKYRFQWNFPIFFSPHKSNRLYATSNQVHVSEDGGESWKIISPDLTRNDASKLGPSGGPITKDNTAVEYYCTIFAGAESPQEEGVIWVGSDDGLIHVTRNGGDDWNNVTPSGMPEWMMINSIDVDPFVKGGAYVAGTKYKSGDYTPYLYRTKDYGKTWTKITDGIGSEDFTRVVRADPSRQGLLYAGTEHGMYISFDDGASWSPLQNNLPIVPITDLTIKNNNLIVATQGRSFWLIDDITPFHQLNSTINTQNFTLFSPIESYRMDGRGGRASKTAGTNHPGGVNLHYYLGSVGDSAKASMEIMHANGDLIKKFSTDSKEKGAKLEVKEGMNIFRWNMRYSDATSFKGLIMWAGNTTGPIVPPGKYKAKMTVDGVSQETEFVILADPRSDATQADYEEQFAFQKEVNDKLSETNQAIIDIRKVRDEMDDLVKRYKGDDDMKDVLDAIKDAKEKMKGVEEELYQTKNRSRQDPLNYPIKLNNKLAHLNGATRGNYRPTKQAKDVKKEIMGKIDKQLQQWNNVMEQDLPAINKMIKGKAIDALDLKRDKKSS